MSNDRDLRRVRSMAVHMDLVNHWLHSTPATHCPDMPSDAKMVNWIADHDRNCVLFHIVSDSFEPVESGARIPSWSPLWRAVGDEELAALRSEVEAVRDEMRAAKQARRIDAFSEGAVDEWMGRLDKALGVATPEETTGESTK